MGLLQRLIGAALGILLFIAAFVFASVALALLIVAGLGVWAWLWWRSRKLGLHRGARSRGGSIIIEGEFEDITPSQRIEDRERR
ncbi:MAG: hypothetical protein EPO20_05715 [Betaproteobacteria bacterium]|nr:MAG: hypothetical protein EPO20_05715 [Betaproteobacteria bacterium]